MLLMAAISDSAAVAGCQPALSVGASSTANNGHCVQTLRVTGGTGADTYKLYVNGRLLTSFGAHTTVDMTYRVTGTALRFSLVRAGATDPVSSGTLSCLI